MGEFVAIDVGQGDAFFLKREGFSTLVDGGRARLGFPQQFERVVGTDGVDVLVCSHNDADQAYGVLGFLQAGLHCDDVWLPGSWLGALPRLLAPLPDVIDMLVTEIVKVDGEELLQLKKVALEMNSSLLDAFAAHGKGFDEGSNEDVEWKHGGILYPEDEGESWDLWWDVCHSVFHDQLLPPVRLISEIRLKLLISAISAAHRIRTIAEAAFHRGAVIRWFEFGVSAASGARPDQPVPLTSRETVRVKRSPSLLYMLALTVRNREGLVF